jgi:outer membrane protein TolC
MHLEVSPACSRWGSMQLATAVLCSLSIFGSASRGLAQGDSKAETQRPLTQKECITIALRAQPAIHVQEAAVGAATEVQKQARSYFFPQAGITSRYTVLSQPLNETLQNPLGGQLGQTIADSAAFFGIARQAGSAAAIAALAHPNLPPFSIASQAALSQLPANLNVEIFGQSLFYNQALVTQPLYSGGKIRYHNQQAKLGIDVAGADLTKAKQQAIFDVVRAYQGILLARDLTRATQDTVGQFSAVERLAQSLLDGGDDFVTTADLARARALRLLAANQQIEFERAADLAQAALRQAMGMEAESPVVIADDRLVLERVSVDEATVLSMALTRRPELIKAEIGVKNAQLQEKLARAEFQPTVGLFAGATTLSGIRSFPNPGNDFELQAGIAGEIPLFAGGRNIAGVRRSQHQLQQAVESQKLARDYVTLEVKQVFLDYKEMSERLGLAESAVNDAQVALKSYNDQFSAKLIADKDVPKYFENISTGRLLLFTAQARYNQHVYAYNLALAKIRLVTAADD